MLPYMDINLMEINNTTCNEATALKDHKINLNEKRNCLDKVMAIVEENNAQ